MSDMTTKRLMMAGALAALAASPVSAQIAKFHLTTPALPGAVTLDRIASDGVLGDFLGSTGEMNQERAASLEEMREAETISAAAGQEIDDDRTDDVRGLIGGLLDLGERDDNEGTPQDRPVIAAVDNEEGAPSVAPRPTFDRQVIVRTRTKTPRGGSKIKTGTIWSVGEFR